MNPLRRQLSDIERSTLRRGQTAANEKYSIGGRLKQKATLAPAISGVPVNPRGRQMSGRTSKQAAGIRDGKLVKLVCAIDPETFDTIRARAVKAQTSVAEQIRLLLEWGLEADDGTT